MKRANSGPRGRLGILLALAVLLPGCGSGTDGHLPGPTGSVSISPDQLVLQSGYIYVLVIKARDAEGDTVPASSLHWTSTDPSIAVGDATGRVISGRPGTATLTASVAGAAGTVLVTVIPGGDASITVAPLTSTILVGGTTDFTAVVRDAEGDEIHPGVVWSTSDPRIATIAQSGRATGVAAGTTEVLASADGIIGRAHLVVTAPASAVSSVQVVPAQTALTVGDQVRFTAEPRDQNGNVMSGLPVSWTSSNSAIASVANDGTALGRTEGDVQITATISGVTGSGALHVGPAPSNGGNWPHEPSGFTPISDQQWTVAEVLDWFTQFGVVSIGLDLSAPLSPPAVLTITYPTGFQGGSAPGTMTRLLPGGKRFFFATWWKASSPWQGHNTNVNKILFFFPASNGDVTMVMYGRPGGPYELRVLPQFAGIPSNWLVPNIVNVPVTLGTWHKLEWLIDYGDDTGTGTVRWWMDDQMIGSYGGLQFPTQLGGSAFKISPTWGGVGDAKTETDYFWFDETYLSYQP